jgi:hypothetical protein
MRTVIALACLIAVAGCGTRASVRQVTDGHPPPHSGKVCIVRALPSGLAFSSVAFVDTYMQHYGSAEYLLDGMADEARKVGADAVIGVESGQEFGYFAWRVVRPRAKGHAVKLTEPEKFNCAAIGGELR